MTPDDKSRPIVKPVKPVSMKATMPIRDAKVACCVLGKTVEAFAERFVINFLPKREQPLRRFRFRHGSGCHYLLFVFQGRFVSPHIRRLAPYPVGDSIGHGCNYV